MSAIQTRPSFFSCSFGLPSHFFHGVPGKHHIFLASELHKNAKVTTLHYEEVTTASKKFLNLSLVAALVVTSATEET